MRSSSTGTGRLVLELTEVAFAHQFAQLPGSLMRCSASRLVMANQIVTDVLLCIYFPHFLLLQFSARQSASLSLVHVHLRHFPASA